MRQIFLQLHVLAGIISLLSAFVAVGARAANWPHQMHVVSGRIYTYGMWTIFFTALPLALIFKHNLFLLVISIFSAYLATAGWRYARHRAGTPRLFDWMTAGAMALTALIMLAYGSWLLNRGDKMGIVLLVFSVAGGALAALDIRSLREGGLTGKARIAQHLTMMLASCIAVITAVLVTQVKLQPAFILWITPTFVITPAIIYWRRKQGEPRPVNQSTHTQAHVST